MFDTAILVVDDDELYRNMFAEKFREEKFRVLTATDGQEAWGILQRETPDVLLTGILMPRLDGFTLIERLRGDSRYSRMKVFILSHHGRPEDRARADAFHVDGFFTMGYVPFAEIILRIRASTKASPSFTLRLDPTHLDDDSRAALMKIGEELTCRRCDAPFVVTLSPDPLRPLGFFSAHIECPVCDE